MVSLPHFFFPHPPASCCRKSGCTHVVHGEGDGTAPRPFARREEEAKTEDHPPSAERPLERLGPRLVSRSAKGEAFLKCRYRPLATQGSPLLGIGKSGVRGTRWVGPYKRQGGGGTRRGWLSEIQSRRGGMDPYRVSAHDWMRRGRGTWLSREEICAEVKIKQGVGALSRKFPCCD